MAFGDRHLKRVAHRGPLSGTYITLCFNLASAADTPACIAPCELRVVDVSFYVRTSTAGTITVTSTDPNVTVMASGALTANTPLAFNGAAVSSRTINKGSTVKAAGGGTLADGTCIVTCVAKDFVIVDEAND